MKLRIATISFLADSIYIYRRDTENGITIDGEEMSLRFKLPEGKFTHYNWIVDHVAFNMPEDSVGISYVVMDGYVEVYRNDVLSTKTSARECPINGMHLAEETKKVLPDGMTSIVFSENDLRGVINTLAIATAFGGGSVDSKFDLNLY